MLHSDSEEMCGMYLDWKVINAVNNCQLRNELMAYRELFEALANSYEEFVSKFCDYIKIYPCKQFYNSKISIFCE